MDKRKNNGGARKNAGRKTKEEEDRIRALSINAMQKNFKSEEGAWQHLAKMAKDSYPHLRLLFEYCYGKPKETVNLEGPKVINIEYTGGHSKV